MVDLPDLVEVVSGRPEKFMVFCDDLSFEEGEPGYKALKSILDGSVAASTPNVLIYATSNRRHLLPGVHEGEPHLHPHRRWRSASPARWWRRRSRCRNASRLRVSFYPFSQDEYLHITATGLEHFGVPKPEIEAAWPRRWCGRWSAVRAAAAWPTSSPATTRGGTTRERIPVVADGDRRARAGRTARRSRSRWGVLIRADGAFLLTLAATGQGLRRVLGVPGRQGRSRRVRGDRCCGASCRRKSASPSVRSILAGWSAWTTPCAGAAELLQGP